MQRIFKQFGCVAGFHNLPAIHNGNMVGCAGDDAQIMGDENHAHVEFFL
jgi:hypothetical protein